MPKSNLYQCAECGLHYADKETAKKCQMWCGKYKSCNLEITEFSEEVKAQQKNKPAKGSYDND